VIGVTFRKRDAPSRATMDISPPPQRADRELMIKQPSAAADTLTGTARSHKTVAAAPLPEPKNAAAGFNLVQYGRVRDAHASTTVET
jgi:hypothetical protein